MTKIRVAIIGYGLAGRVFHAPFIAVDEAYELAMIVTSNPERAQAAASLYPNTAIVPSVDQVFADGANINLVVVASPNDTHVLLATRAIEAGKDVVVDKPIAPLASQAQKLVDRAKKLGRTVTVFQNRRWDGDFLTVKQILESGELGQVLQFESTFTKQGRRPGKHWKNELPTGEGGGIAYDLAPHLIDQAVQLFGPVVHSYAELDADQKNLANDNDAFFALTHKGGVRSRLWMSNRIDLTGPRLKVIGTEGTFETFGLDIQESQLIAGMIPGAPGYGVDTEFPTGLLTQDGDVQEVAKLTGQYPDFYAGLAIALKDRTDPPVDPADAIATLEIIELGITDFVSTRATTV